ncbi:hypothetical protein O7635_23990 [Asanoa sp. WMMD1127]|uniref:hypothetical protein n=1 Tax=Asanoa sp. WMMD1127 TaxID=3016107 RepID=UPI002416A8FF|nr:hypothetical protein [Asanoa sp. WMMD1127]MDG4824922.1 hypothetical protein [Asanoa sp. WMMD1127]
MTLFAEAMTKDTWHEIASELDRAARDAAGARRELADHGWCELFVAMARATETARRAFNSIPDIVKGAILASPSHIERSYVTDAVVVLVVDKVWKGFEAATFAGFPLLDLVTSEEATRALRIMAVFICPAPEKHRDVRRYALKPLGDDAAKILTDQTKARLGELFTEWRPI